MTFVNPQRQNVFVANSATEDEPAGTFAAGRRGDVQRDASTTRWRPGRYALSTRGRPARQRRRARSTGWENLATIVVTGARAGGGLVDLAHDADDRARVSTP